MFLEANSCRGPRITVNHCLIWFKRHPVTPLETRKITKLMTVQWSIVYYTGVFINLGRLDQIWGNTCSKCIWSVPMLSSGIEPSSHHHTCGLSTVPTLIHDIESHTETCLSDQSGTWMSWAASDETRPRNATHSLVSLIKRLISRDISPCMCQRQRQTLRTFDVDMAYLRKFSSPWFLSLHHCGNFNRLISVSSHK